MTQDDSSTPQNQSTSTAGSAQDTSAKTGTTSTVQIPAAIAQKYPDLQALINETESMTQEERDYWYQILPIMTEEQIEKLRGILVHEKDQLAKLDQEYEQELSKLNEKHLLEWKEHETREKREKLRSEEGKHEAEEAATEAALLAQLSALDDDDDYAPKT